MALLRISLALSLFFCKHENMRGQKAQTTLFSFLALLNQLALAFPWHTAYWYVLNRSLLFKSENIYVHCRDIWLCQTCVHGSMDSLIGQSAATKMSLDYDTTPKTKTDASNFYDNSYLLIHPIHKSLPFLDKILEKRS